MVLFCLPYPSFCCTNNAGADADADTDVNADSISNDNNREEERRNLLLEMLFFPNKYKKKNLLVDFIVDGHNDVNGNGYSDNCKDKGKGNSNSNDFDKDGEKEEVLSRTTHSTFDSQFDDQSISSNENSIKSFSKAKAMVAIERSRLRPPISMPMAKASAAAAAAVAQKNQPYPQARTRSMLKTNAPLASPFPSRQEVTTEDLAFMLTPTPFTIFLNKKEYRDRQHHHRHHHHLQDEMSLQSSSLLSLGVDLDLDLDLDLKCDHPNSSYYIDIDGDSDGDGDSDSNDGGTKWEYFENFFEEIDATDIDNNEEEEEEEEEEEGEMSVVTCCSTSPSLAIKFQINARSKNMNASTTCTSSRSSNADENENENKNNGFNHQHHRNILVLVNRSDEDEGEFEVDNGNDETLQGRKRNPIEPEGELFEPTRKRGNSNFHARNNNKITRISPSTANNIDNYDDTSKNDNDNDDNDKDHENVEVPQRRKNSKIFLRSNRFSFHPSFYYKLDLNDSSDNCDDGDNDDDDDDDGGGKDVNDNKKNEDNDMQRQRRNYSSNTKLTDPKRRRFQFLFFRRRRKQRRSSLPATSTAPLPSSSSPSSSPREVNGNNLHLDITALQKLNALYNSEPILASGRNGTCNVLGRRLAKTTKQNNCSSSASTNSETNISSLADERSMMMMKKRKYGSPSSMSSESHFYESTHSDSSFITSYHAQSDDGRNRNTFSQEEEVSDSLATCFMQYTVQPTISMVLTQFKGRLSKRSKIVDRVLHSSHDSSMMMDSIRLSILDEDEGVDEEIEGGGDSTSISSLRAETDVSVVADPFARPSKRMKKACNHLSGDGDVWVEKIMKNKKTGRRRSFFYSIKTGERKMDEPPSGASTVIFSLTELDHGRSRTRRWKPNEEIEGDNDLWVERVQFDEKTDKERSFFYSTKTGFRHVDEPPTGASKIMYTTDTP